MKTTPKIIVSFLFLISTGNSFAQEAFTVSTFHNISIYWSPDNGAEGVAVGVEFKPTDSEVWRDGLDMRYNPIPQSGINPVTGLRGDKADYRGCIVNLQPNTVYDIRLTLESTGEVTNLQGATWSEEFPIGQVIEPGSMTTRLSYGNLTGTPEAYVLIDGTNETIHIDDGSVQCIRLIDCAYVIIRGYTMTNAAESAIRLFGSHHIVIENCDISDWGEEDIPGTGFGVGYQAGIYAGANHAYSCVFQRNKIHHPKWDTNSWAELHDPNSDPENHSNYHPDGPQGIALGECNIGNNVIRYNEMWSDEEHYFNDILGLWANGSYAGFPGPDSDIYNNYLANCFDDGIETEGCNTNVRIWNNYIEEVFIGIGNAASSIGPLYVWRNVSGRAYSHQGSVYGDYGGFLKMGFANSIDWMTGHMYVFNNTILQPNDHGCGGLGTSYGSNRYIKHCTTLNNILQVRSSTNNSISTEADNVDNSYDYDLTNHPIPIGQEGNGITGEPTYSIGAPTFDFASKMGDFQLSTASLGYDDGVVIPNFCDSYMGEAPDMGAHENGWDAFEYGTLSTFNPPNSINSPTWSLTLKAQLQGASIPGVGLMHDALRQSNVIPTEEPYTALGYTQVSGGGEIVSPAVLDVNGSDAIVDWVLVELRGGVIPNAIVATQAALIQRDGDVVSIDGVSPVVFDAGILPDAVYIVLHHRNHLGVRTLNFINTSLPAMVDFSNPATEVLGNNPMILMDGKNMLVSGDANNDGAVNTSDINSNWRMQNTIPFVYLSTGADFNLDGTVNAVDRNLFWRMNNGKIEELE